MGKVVGGDLETLKALHKGLNDRATQVIDLKNALDGLVEGAVWTGPNADEFRNEWQTFKPGLDKLHTTLLDGAQAVKGQHNGIANATGVPDQI